MNEQVLHLAEVRGFITRPELLDSGLTDRDILALRRLGMLVRVGAGLYALSSTYEPLTAEAKLAVRSKAVFHRHRGHVALTHQSAAAIHGLPMWDVDLGEVHVTRLDDGRGRHESGVQHHVGKISDADVVEVDGVLVSSPDRCVWEMACTSSVESALVTTDAALHRSLVTTESLHEAAAAFRTWRGSRSARLSLTLADGRSESAGESRTRHLFWRHNIPQPELQFRVVDSRGGFLARTDFAWELYRHLAEFDGRIKFDGTFDPAGYETVFAEKRREDLIRAELWGLTRLIWEDLNRRVAKATAERLKFQLERSRTLYVPRVIV